VVLTGPHYQFRGKGEGMKQALLHLWYPLFQALPKRCDQQQQNVSKNINTMLESIVSCTQRTTKDGILAIRIWFKIDYSFTITCMSYDDLVYYLIFI
jgi:hypothetical protein